MNAGRTLPPGQHAARWERFGLPQFAGRHVNPPVGPMLTIVGEVRRPTQVGLRELIAGLPRREQSSDLHCVTTWTALDLQWSGTAFREVVARIAQLVRPDPRARWLRNTGLDGFASCLLLEDAMADDVVLADQLDGDSLSARQGGPARLVAPAHYGYKSVKHLVMIEYRRGYPGGSAGWKEHPRGRVAAEERSRVLPGFVWRAAWRAALPLARRPYRTG